MKKNIVIIGDTRVGEHRRPQGLEAAIAAAHAIGVPTADIIMAGDLGTNFNMPFEIKASQGSYDWDKPILEKEVDLSFYHKIGNQKNNNKKRRGF